ncbi:MAG: META domain-containing protein [Caldilineae bacterium]|nr:MAG: META domain-containing protein [Caldilineae bacterium]
MELPATARRLETCRPANCPAQLPQTRTNPNMNHFPKHLLALTMLLLGLTLAACSTTAIVPALPENTPTPHETMASPEGTAWSLQKYRNADGELVPPLAGTEITLDLQQDRLGGSAGCNDYFASYQPAGERLGMGPVASTRKMCLQPQGIMDQEGAYLKALGLAASYRLTGDSLILLDEGDRVVATFVPVSKITPQSALPLNTTWQWQELHESEPASVSVPRDPEKYTLTFLEDGSVSIQADCNRAQATYSLEGNNLVLLPGPATLAFCGEDSLDTLFLQMLGKVVAYSIEDGRLVLHLADNGGRMVFAAQD